MKKTFCDICKREITSEDLFPFDGLFITLNDAEFLLAMKPFDSTKDFCNSCILKQFVEEYTQHTLGHKKTKRNLK